KQDGGLCARALALDESGDEVKALGKVSAGRMGMGAGAHGYANQTRTVNVMKPEIYIERLKNLPPNPLPFPQTPATMTAEPIDRQTDMFETIFTGLRLLNEGLSLTAFEERYGEKLEAKFADEIRR
ncbi:MAG: hypothetical protein EDM75_15510, partial [Chlorobiota bacterium]